MSQSRISKTWEARVKTGVFTRAQCRTWCHHVVSLAETGMSSGQKTAMTPDEAQDLVEIMDRQHGVALEAEHTEFGREWLRNNAKQFPAWVQDDFLDFRFQGDGFDVAEDNPYRSQYVPIWLIRGRHGQRLKYCCFAWQSGYGRSGLLILGEGVDVDYERAQEVAFA